MAKREIAHKVREKLSKEGLEIKKKEVYSYVSEIFKIIQETLLKGEKVQISGFGTFIVKQRKPKKGMNLKEMKIIEIPSRKVVLFKPSKNFLK